MKIMVIQGPNINMLGMREPAIYGVMKMEDIHKQMKAVADQSDDAAHNSEHENECDTVHGASPLSIKIRFHKVYCDARRRRYAPTMMPTMFGSHTAGRAGSTSPRANALPIVISA